MGGFCVPSLLLDLRPNCGGDNEDDGDFLQKVSSTQCHIHCPQPCSRPPPTHASFGYSWTLIDKSGLVSCGVMAPFSWVLVCKRLFFFVCLFFVFVCTLQEFVSPVLSKFYNQIAEKRREAKGKEEKKRYTHLNAEFQRIAWRDKKAFLSDQCKEMEENNRMRKTRDLFKKISDTKGTLNRKMDRIKN